MDKINSIKKLIIPASSFGSRLDHALVELIPEYSRAKIQSLIKGESILINDKKTSSKLKVLGGEAVTIIDKPSSDLNDQPEEIALEIIYEDEDILVINKQKGLVVHPGSGNLNGTLLNALIYHYPNNESLPRGGIVHRLDKDTTGLMVVARNESSQNNLVEQLQSKSVYREYRAIVWGQLWKDKILNKPIGRHPKQRTKMAINKVNGKEAVTKMEILERFNFHSYIRCLLQTGRTHQIRVHMADNQSPIVGDPTYGMKKIIPTRKIDSELLQAVKDFDRQALHAISLGLVHPKSEKKMKWTIDLPDDMKSLLSIIRTESERNLIDDKDVLFLEPSYEINQPIEFDDE